MTKKTIKNTGYVIAAAAMTLNVQSCKKYQDGPALSLRTKKARLAGDWDVVQIGNQNYPSNGYSLEFEFEKDGDMKFTYAYTGYSYSYKGSWEFSSNKEELDIKLDGNSSTQTFEILRLKNKEVWLEDKDGGDEWRLEAQ
jgi:hypothetical protein